MPEGHLSRLFTFLRGIVAAAILDPARLAEDRIWIELRDAFAFLILLLTGLRRFEFCALVCGDIDFASGKLWVIGKGRVRDFVPLPDSAIELLTKWFEVKRLRGESVSPDAPLFAATGAGGFLSLSNLRLRWKETLRLAGVPTSYEIHATRHAAAMIVFAQTGSIEKVARFLRHQGTRVTSVFYAHLDAESLRRELSTIEQWRRDDGRRGSNVGSVSASVARRRHHDDRVQGHGGGRAGCARLHRRGSSEALVDESAGQAGTSVGQGPRPSSSASSVGAAMSVTWSGAAVASAAPAPDGARTW